MSGIEVVVDARVRPGEQGGVQQAVMGLASGLSGLEGPDRYTFVVQGDPAWLAPHVSGPCRLVTTTFPGARQRRVLRLADRVGGTGARDAVRLLLETGVGVLPRPDPVVGRIRPDVVHFMKHRGWRTRTPNVYVPHDLQHVDMPDHFSATTRAYRRIVYGAMARQATRVVALTEDQRLPLIRHYRLEPDAVVTIGWASALAVYDIPPRPVPGLPPRFALMPARSWPHKRHDVLLRAVGRLRREGVDVPVVLTGGRTDGWDALADLARREGVTDLVTHLGYVDEAAMKTLYGQAHVLVFPSDHEGFGLPVVEAMTAGVAVVCSDIPVLASLTGAAARRFRPGDAEGLADALGEVWQQPDVRAALVAAGTARARGFTWADVATRYAQLYRSIAGWPADRTAGSAR